MTSGRAGDRLREARQNAGFKSARSAAMNFGWTPSTYASHENGQTSVPVGEAKIYAQAFKSSWAWILTGEKNGRATAETESPIRFDLLSNARDSLKRAVDLIAWDDFNSDHAKLKHAITNAAHAIELLLKERLRREHPAFIWQNVDKYRSLQALTVTAETAVNRLTTVCGVVFTESDRASLLALRTTRNAIEHYEWHASEAEAKIIVGNALSFALGFADEHLGIDLSADFKKDDTWRMLLQQAQEFARAHSARIATKAPNVFLMRCDECEKEMVTDVGSCLLCGHWQETGIFR